MVRDYFPAIAELHSDRFSSATLAAALPEAEVETIPVPRDCADLFFAALWAAPSWSSTPTWCGRCGSGSASPSECGARASERLAADLASGAWEERNGHLRG